MAKTKGTGAVWIVRDPLFGDGGKARMVDYLTGEDRVSGVVRWNGGDNAGHTVVVGDKKIALHAVPAGVVRNSGHRNECAILSVIGRGVVINLKRLHNEIDSLNQVGIWATPKTLLISEGAHLTLAYHMALESAREESVGKKDTTKKAISQTYAFGRLYQGIRAGDLRNLKLVKELIQEPLAYANGILQQVYGKPPVSTDEVMAELENHRDFFLPFLGNEILALNRIIHHDGKIVICEGAQSGMLDPDLGIYPNTTASNTWPGSIQHGCGLDPRLITRDILVVKAFTSRVGIGPLVAEIKDNLADLIREKGKEFGTTTGRPRRIGWNDQVIARYCALVGPGTELAITKVDILTGIDPLKICIDYNHNGVYAPIFPTNAEELASCEPVFMEMPGWTKDITGITEWRDLPKNAADYLEAIAKPYGCPIKFVGTGPERSQLIVRWT